MATDYKIVVVPDTGGTRPCIKCPKCLGLQLLPYSGKIWRGINFGGLANLSKGRQIKNSPIFSSCACVSVSVHFVRA